MERRRHAHRRPPHNPLCPPTMGPSPSGHAKRWSSASIAAAASSLDAIVTSPQPLVVGAPCGRAGGEGRGAAASGVAEAEKTPAAEAAAAMARRHSQPRPSPEHTTAVYYPLPSPGRP
jgi:hypothetical protein